MSLADWCEYHATLFGLRADSDADMLLEWSRLFSQQGYGAGDLRAASEWIAMNDPPKTRPEHLALLTRRLREQRAASAPMPDDDPRGQCSLCGGTGRVTVPMVRGVHSDQGNTPRVDDRYTCAVLCRCKLGQWFTDKQGGGFDKLGRPKRPAPMTIDQYEQLVPDWRERLKARDAAARASLRAQRAAEEADRRHGPLPGAVAAVLRKAVAR